MQTETTRQSDEILPPIVGSIVTLPLTAAVLVVDLTSWAQTAALPIATVHGSSATNPLGQYITLLTQQSGVCIAFARTAAALAGLSATATSTVVQTAGATQFQIPGGFTTNASVPLSPGIPFQFRMPPGPRQPVDATGQTTSDTQSPWGANSFARFLGAIMGAATGNLTMWVSSK